MCSVWGIKLHLLSCRGGLPSFGVRRPAPTGTGVGRPSGTAPAPSPACRQRESQARQREGRPAPSPQIPADLGWESLPAPPPRVCLLLAVPLGGCRVELEPPCSSSARRVSFRRVRAARGSLGGLFRLSPLTAPRCLGAGGERCWSPSSCGKDGAGSPRTSRAAGRGVCFGTRWDGQVEAQELELMGFSP